MYMVFLNGMLLPVTPGKIQLKIKNRNKTIDLINDGEVNILKSAGLTEISFECLLPQFKYPFAVYQDGFEPPDYFLTKLEGLKNSLKPFQFILARYSPRGRLLSDLLPMWVSLEEYTITHDAGEGFDISVSVNLKQYRIYGTKTVIYKETADETVAAPAAGRETESAPAAATYTVVKGDNLFNIAKKCLGDGSRYTEIYNLNRDKIVNPNLIYPGQVLTLPG